jgi:putative drug exporter of the RND superfamily
MWTPTTPAAWRPVPASIASRPTGPTGCAIHPSPGRPRESPSPGTALAAKTVGDCPACWAIIPTVLRSRQRRSRGVREGPVGDTAPSTKRTPLGMIGTYSVRFAVPIICFWLVAAFLLFQFLPSLPSVTQTQASDFLPAAAPSVQAAELNAPFQNPDLATATIVAATDRPLSSSDLAAITALEARARTLHNVAGVVDEGISADRDARRALVETTVGAIGRGNSGKAVVDQIRGLLGSVHQATGLDIHLTGPLADDVDQNDANNKAEGRTAVLSILLIVLILLIVFRAPLAPLIALAPPALALVLAGPVIAGFSKLGLSVSEFTDFMLIVVVLGAGTDYGLFLIFRFREERGRGGNPREAVVRAVEKAGRPILMSAVTVIAAFIPLSFVNLGIYRSLGPPLAIAIGLVALVDLTLLPALLAVFGDATFWPTAPGSGSSDNQHTVWNRVAQRVVDHPLPVLVSGVAAFGILALFGLGYSPTGFGGGEIAPAGSDSAIGEATVSAHFPAAEADPTYVVFRFLAPVWKLPAVVEQAQILMSDARGFSHIAGPLDPNGTALTYQLVESLHHKLGPANELGIFPPRGAISVADYEAYRATSGFISSDGSTLRFDTTLSAGQPESNGALRAIPSVRETVHTIARKLGALEAGVSGDAPVDYDEVHFSDKDLLLIIPLVLLIIGVLLGLQLRSFAAPLFLVASVLLSYLATIGLAVIVFVLVGGAEGLSFVFPFVAFMFLMALGEDYNILLMTRVKEEAANRPLTDAVRRAVGYTGTTITSAGLILAGTFVTLSIATTGPIREIGIGVAAGLLLDTFVVRTLLVPSTIVLLGRLTWRRSPRGN